MRQGELFSRDECDEEDEGFVPTRTYVDYLDFSQMETTGTDGGGEDGCERRRLAVARAQALLLRDIRPR